MTWTNDELSAVSTPDELRLATRRRDGTLRDPVTIWHVRLGDDLYVRSVNGPSAAWYRGAQIRRQARVAAGGVERDVELHDGEDALDDQIDAAYRDKYRRYSANTLQRITSPQARSTTLRLVPTTIEFKEMNAW